MNDFLTAWAAVDQHVYFFVFLAALAGFTGWVLYGEHRSNRGNHQ